MNDLRSILLVEDDRALSDLLAEDVRAAGFRVVVRASGQAALDAVAAEAFDAVVTDVHLPGRLHGTELCKLLLERDAELPVVVMTAYGTLDNAIAALRAGAEDLLIKPFETEVLIHSIERSLKQRSLVRRVRALQSALDEPLEAGDFVGKSPAFRRALDLARRVAPTDVAVLVTGEAGTGKELVARALHRGSPRAAGPFVSVSCSAIPEALLESELFGHVRGALPDAKADAKGLLATASGGTLFLDEIGALPLALQPKLLRALQDGRALPIGADREVPADVRVVAASRRDLTAAIEEGRFREDLYYRLNVVEVQLPPLRERAGDILLLAQHFLLAHAARMKREITGIQPAAAEKLLAYNWPGNVRELSSCVERAVALASHQNIAVADLPERIRDHQTSRTVVEPDDTSTILPLDEVERRYIVRVLEACGGHKQKAASLLKIDRKTLYRKLQEYGVSSEHASK